MKHARKGMHVTLPTPSIPCLILFQNQRMMCTDYIKREHDNDMYVHLLQKKKSEYNRHTR